MRRLFPTLALAVGLLLGASIAQGQTWNLQVVDDTGDTGYDSQIVVASDGTPYIFYRNTSNVLMLAWWVGGGWQFRQLDNYAGNNGTPFEVIADSSNRFHVAWSRNSSPYIKYGIYDPVTQNWLLGPEGIGQGAYSCNVDLTLHQIGPDLIPVIAWNAENNVVSVHKRTPGTGVWTGGVVDPTRGLNRPASVGVDSAGDMHLSYYDNAGLNLMYATKGWDAATWAISTVDITGNVGDYSSLVVMPDDSIHIVYYDTTNGDLKYASLTP